ncbi:hypothetical protein E8E12_001850 [Didymella heteroderae]|uniref:Uncharacterized protein n=1 Tax=Didymella heteroderae TaxID=1769908 RepID=A0A9P4WQA4_9PLEO|nr:hypothetical protein E8E12_001850 [Didymella heteroderae]
MDPLSSPPVDMAQATVSFLVLPAEVRHMIYHYLFPEGRSAVQLLKRNAGKGYISMSDRLGMIATCRQIYREATGVLQEQNRLAIVKPETFRQLVQKLWIEIYYDSDDDECFDYHILQHLIPLQGIHLHYDLDNRTEAEDDLEDSKGDMDCLFDIDSDQGSLLGVAADLAQRIDETEGMIFW